MTGPSAQSAQQALLNYDPTDPDKMRLPVGTTCGDCAHISRCKAIFGHVETDTYCDWSPSRLRVANTGAKP
jgi:hypothetical protein